jgi:hypothetical protein
VAPSPPVLPRCSSGNHRPPAQPARPARYTLPFTTEGVHELELPGLALSADGSKLAIVQERDGLRRIILRRLDRFDDQPIAGTEGGTGPFFSPDGEWLGVFADQKLKKVPVAGGTPVALAEAPRPAGASWGAGDSIVFVPKPLGGLARVPAAGGPVRQITTVDGAKNERVHSFPALVLRRNVVLYTVAHTSFSQGDSKIVALDLDTGDQRVLLKGGEQARCVPPGHIVYMRDDVLSSRLSTRSRSSCSAPDAPFSKASWRAGASAISAWYAPP